MTNAADENEAKLMIMEPKEDERLSKEVYDTENAMPLTEKLVAELRERIKRELRMPRYKLGIQIILGEIKGQGLRIASKCLWDVQNDNYTSYTFTNEKIYCTGICFGCYFD
ncbi:hypothetical protein IMG5_097130 [Ichthyophthirius multifiliis]|uniref:Dynein light chain n=1 Tax=Ichthyophthirius multifiliis TaxID=5932 RepID=G0QRR2_ICHMU|nr:hypothetical protein IMG5_097130 [Ichthyophthirius multifiliis]EGR32099.1 hypothetical protein IMG5_097130 [Ichthyophthirius multifiliis]|eukprot:XP_004035585.1 hypothetical protein IMG5_097130 [Ichthyophthirius multifiliis]